VVAHGSVLLEWSWLNGIMVACRVAAAGAHCGARFGAGVREGRTQCAHPGAFGLADPLDYFSENEYL